MTFNATTQVLSELTADCRVVFVGADSTMGNSAQQLDKASGGIISRILALGDFTGKFGQTQLLPEAGELNGRLLLVGTGKAEELKEGQFRTLVKNLISAVKDTKIASLALSLDDIELKGRDFNWKARLLAENTVTTLYVFDQMKSKQADPSALTEIILSAPGAEAAVQQALNTGAATGEGMNIARTLGNLPGNICTPVYLAEQAQELGKDFDELTVTILDENQMAELGMNSLLSVAKGSVEAPRLITMEYNGAGSDTKPHVLVGKGVTFDSGGISLKPGEGMDEMKYDMCGAASVFGTMQVLKQLKPKINVVGVVAAVENMPAGNASKPGDVVTTMSGKTVEILNTDAEGRLVLCDALTYIDKFNPETVVDIATLTGACIIGLGHHASGLLSNDDTLAAELLSAGIDANDKAWQMPLWAEYQQQLDSNFADIANIGGRPAGTITAACFLSRFTEDYRWAHLDIAGTAWHSGKEKGATGRPVPLLTQYVLSKVDANA